MIYNPLLPCWQCRQLYYLYILPEVRLVYCPHCHAHLLA